MTNSNRISDQENSQIFLATTALEEFWDTSKPIVFLGEWCRRYSRRSSWERLNGQILPPLLKNREKICEAYKYINEVYEKFLPVLGDVLNKLHNKKFSTRYWRIVVGPWLFHYIDVVYDRYIHLRAAIDKYPNFTTIGLAKESFIIPRDSLHYGTLVPDDLYNLQIYTRILSAMGRGVPRKAVAVNRSVLAKPVTKGFKQLALKFLNSFYDKFNRNPSVVLVNAYFSQCEQLKLFLKTGGKFVPYYKEYPQVPEQQVDNLARLKYLDLNVGKDDFEILLQKTIPYDLPQSLIENYNFIGEKANTEYPRQAKAILSGVMWYWHDDFKHWAAEASEKGTKLIGIQHGGNYGSVSLMSMLNHELTITNSYYSWGWSGFSNDFRVNPMPATKLVGRKKIRAKNDKKGIVFSAVVIPRYLYRMQYFTNYNYLNYLNWQYRFISSLLPEIRRETRLRINQNDYGWDFRERWNECSYSDVEIENTDKPFWESLRNSRIYVADYLSTTFLEALSADKPTVLFWDHGITELTEESKAYYDELYRAGILHVDPESAAKSVNLVYDDVESWWNDSSRQKIVKKFCSHFAMTSSNAVNEWAAELKAIAEQ